MRKAIEEADAGLKAVVARKRRRQPVRHALADDGVRRGVAAGQVRSARSTRRRCWSLGPVPTTGEDEVFKHS